MAIYHMSAKIISRGAGGSSIASAAYRSGSKLVDEWVNETKDFTRKKHVVYSDILLPANAPREYADREILWNAVEQFEKKSNAQLAREIEFSLPAELPFSERLKAAREFADFFRKQGMVVDMNIHEPDYECPNPHCHMMMTMRPFKDDGTFVEQKSYRRYLLDENGEKILNKKGTDYKFEKVLLYDWDNKENVGKWRHVWQDIENGFYERNGLDIRVNCESYEAQGIDLIPTIHEGAAVRAMERKGIKTEIGSLNREIKAVNAMTIESNKKISTLGESLRALIFRRNAVLKEQRDAQPRQETLLGILREWQSNRDNFIREKGIHQRTSTQLGNLKDYSVLVSFIQQHNLNSVEDMQKLMEQCAKERSDIIAKRRDNSRRRKDLSFILSDYEQYQPLSKYYLTHEDKKGWAKERFYDKYAAKIEQAATYRTGMLNMCKKMELPPKIAPKQWSRKLEKLRGEDTALNTRYGEICSCLETLEQIQKEVSSVYRSRQTEQDKTLHAEKNQRTSAQKKRREESL